MGLQVQRNTCYSTCHQVFEAFYSFTTNSLTVLFENTLRPLCTYFLEISVFREAALQNKIEKGVILPLTATIGNLWLQMLGFEKTFTAFDPKRLKEGEAFLDQFRVKEKLTTPSERKVLFSLFIAEKFENWVQAATDKELACFKYEKNQKACSSKKEGSSRKTILYCNGFGLKPPTIKKKISQHLAKGYDFATFEWGDGVSIPGYFEDLECAYQQLIHMGKSAQDITVVGYCGATYPAFKLLEKHHKKGLKGVFINPHPSLRAVVQKQIWPASTMGLWGLGTLETEDSRFDAISCLSKVQLKNPEKQICIIIR